ncbi:hypothetical protein MNBD_BACTEROID02-1012, partial [hydrothermal vent metagenome]
MKSNKLITSIISIFFMTFYFVTAQNINPEVIDIDSRLELFTDHYLIDKLDNASLKLHEPVDQGIVMKFDNPWEGRFSGYCTVIKDDNIFRLYYRGIPTAGKDGRTGEYTCYAESLDGIHWSKPNVGIFEINGSLNNNVVLAEAVPVTHNFSPFLDTKKGIDKKYKYKALGGTEKSGLIAYTSSDGINWHTLQKEPVIRGRKSDFDSQNVSFWSENEQLYICY